MLYLLYRYSRQFSADDSDLAGSHSDPGFSSSSSNSEDDQQAAQNLSLELGDFLDLANGGELEDGEIGVADMGPRIVFENINTDGYVDLSDGRRSRSQPNESGCARVGCASPSSEVIFNKNQFQNAHFQTLPDNFTVKLLKI